MHTNNTDIAASSSTALHDLEASMAVLIAADEAFFEAATAYGLTTEAKSAMTALRHAGDFLQQAAMALATGDGLASTEVVTPFRWAVMKLVEVNMALPEKLRGDLSVDCFRRGSRHRGGRAVVAVSGGER